MQPSVSADLGPAHIRLTGSRKWLFVVLTAVAFIVVALSAATIVGLKLVDEKAVESSLRIYSGETLNQTFHHGGNGY